MPNIPNINEEKVIEALKAVNDPELHKSLVELDMIKDVTVEGDNVELTVVLTTPACPLKKEITDSVEKALKEAGAKEVKVNLDAKVPQGRGLPDKEPIPGVKNTIAVASGKGGVGKSTVSVNLALALAEKGAKVGLLDADVYGPSIPMMLDLHKPISTSPNEKMDPNYAHGLTVISVGFMLDEETPLIWRGPLVMQLVKQFLTGVNWGELDYLIIDLPPGTGDAQLTLAQTIPLSGIVVVSTPQDVALIDARRAIKMFHELEVPILGLIENMSFFECPKCHEKTEIFSGGGGEKTSERYDVPLLGKVPITLDIRIGGDTGKPVVIDKPDSSEAKIFLEIAEKVAARASVEALNAPKVPKIQHHLNVK